MSRKFLFLSGTGLIILSFALAVILYQNTQSTFLGSQGQDVFERQGAPVKGPADARVTIVEFFDPACETCADFYPFLKQLIDQYPGKVKVMMRYAPLHTGSDQVVPMLEAAHKQGKYWQALELLFNNQRRWITGHTSQPMRARGLLNGLALDHAMLDADMSGAEVMSAVQEDIEDGQSLGIKATPEFFVNGKAMPSFGLSQLKRLVKEAVEDAY